METANRSPIVDEMMIGFEPLNRYFTSQPLAPMQKIQLSLLVNLLELAKLGYRPYSKLVGKHVDIVKQISGHRGFDIHIRGTRTQEVEGEHYLSQPEIAEFQKTGVLGPFRAVTTEHAEALRKEANGIHARDYDNSMIFGSDKIRNVLKKHNQWNLNYGGIYQALRYPALWDLLVRKEITQRIASLLGDDILCWRSQFFEKGPGAGGTFWHQTGTFRESSSKPKLQSTQEINDSMVQLTAWIALSDTTVENGCMRLMPNSFTDARFESFAWALLEHKFPYLMSLDRATVQKIMHALKFSTGNFVKAQMVYELAIQEIPDLFDGFTTHDLTMKAGEFVVFTSLNTHGSYPNVTSGDTRLAMAGRYTTNDVKVYDGFTSDQFPTPEGPMLFDLSGVGCMQAHGQDTYGHNRILERPSDSPEFV